MNSKKYSVYLILVAIFCSQQNTLMAAESLSGKGSMPQVQMKLVHTDPWVVGTPLWVAAEIENKSPQSIVGPARAFFAFSGIGYQYEIRSKEGNSIYKKTVPHPRELPGLRRNANGIAFSRGWPMHHIKSGDALRLLFSLDPFPDMPPGQYDLHMTFFESSGEPSVLFSKSVVEIVPATEAQSKVLPKVRPFGPWARPAKELNDEEMVVLEGMPAVHFDVFLRNLLDDRNGISDLDPDTFPLDGAESFFEPEVQAIKSEVFAAKGRKGRSKDVRANTLKKKPGAQWLFDTVTAHGGPVSTGRKLKKLLTIQPK